MTGYGRGEAASGRLKVSAEVRSVNNRVLDIRLRLPQELNPAEEELRRIVREHVSRGSVQMSLHVDGQARNVVRLNRAAARSLRDELRGLARELKLPGEVTLEMLARFPQVAESLASATDEEALREAAAKASRRALEALARSRRREGQVLKGHILEHYRELAAAAADIRRKAAPALRSLKKGYQQRALELAGEGRIDAKRLEEEAVFVAARRDFTEEINRLHAHLATVRRTLGERGPVGRNLEFLTQEILRELTTIASKAPGEEVNRLTIRARVELEKIREQVYNVE